jgi:drug/metabolite transporter (DMT)-like permease
VNQRHHVDVAVRRPDTELRATPWPAYGALVLGVIGIAWAAIFVRWAQVPGVASAFYRLLIATLVLLPWQGPRTRREFAVAPRAGQLAVLAGIFFALDLALWNTSLFYTSAASATLLANTAPLWVGLGTLLLFRERLSGWFWVGMTIALAGAALILGRDLLRHAVGPAPGVGDLLALGAAIFYGAYLLVAGRVRATLDSPTVMTLATAAGAVVLLGMCWLLRAPLTGYAPQQWLALLGLGLVSQLGGVFCINFALGHLPAAVVSVTLLAQPVLVAILGIVLLGESLGPFQVLGGALVLAGIYLVHRLGR